jgi:hypothetical protein
MITRFEVGGLFNLSYFNSKIIMFKNGKSRSFYVVEIYKLLFIKHLQTIIFSQLLIEFFLFAGRLQDHLQQPRAVRASAGLR